MPFEDNRQSEANRAKGQQYADESFAAILADQFQKNEIGKTAVYKAVVAEVNGNKRLTTSEQRSRVMSLLRSGQAESVSKAIEILESDDIAGKNTHR